MRFLAFTLSVALTAPAASQAATSFLEIDPSTATNSILNFFQSGEPSDLGELTLGGTITEAAGAPSLLGQDFRFEFPLLDTTTLQLGGYAFDAYAGDFFDLNALSGSTIELATQVTFDPVGFVDLPGGLYEFTLPEPFDAISSIVGTDPVLDIVITAYLTGPFPTKEFQPFPDEAPEVLYTYIEGALPLDRITLDVVGYTPPMTAVPLPAGAPLLLLAVGALALRRKR